jgi:hypothetical protein
MESTVGKRIAGALFAWALVALPALAQLPRADQVVKPAVYLSLEPVPRGRTFEIAVVGQIQAGFHVNANKVLEDYLIPTTLTAELPAGWKLLETKYPAGKELKVEFSDKPLNVYEGTFVARIKLTAPADAPLGAVKLPLTLRYQACTDTVCLPPVRLALQAEVIIAAANAKAVPVNQKIFASK